MRRGQGPHGIERAGVIGPASLRRSTYLCDTGDTKDATDSLIQSALSRAWRYTLLKKRIKSNHLGREWRILNFTQISCIIFVYFICMGSIWNTDFISLEPWLFNGYKYIHIRTCYMLAYVLRSMKKYCPMSHKTEWIGLREVPEAQDHQEMPPVPPLFQPLE